ncbi:MAG: hypothetical protein LBL63_03285 [Clostridiales Family XIII bacterium]|jgi:acetolactate synthase-1/2/3 large subunit|nr:hypothetical protein [Clostridiales Family XIII bacterium]
MAKYKSGEAFIELLNAHGVDKIFINPGFESIDILSSIAAAREKGKKSPQLVLCLDEAVAVAAAYGNYMVTGKPQVVIVHSELGSLQLGGNLQNLQWGRIPVVILAAYHEIDARRTLWNGQPYDQGGIVRNSVKYDRRLNGDEDLHPVLIEAFRIARTEPTGPVYLCFPMDYLYREIEKPETQPAAEATAALPALDTEALEKMADILLDAKNPLLVSGNAGRYTQNVAALTSLAETLSASTLTGYSWMNFPGNHPLCIGIEQIGGSRRRDAGYDEADVILAIDYAMPYVGNAPPPRQEAKILHIDVDPLTQGRLLWGRGADIFIKADSREAIPALDKLLKEKMTEEKKAELAERFRRIAADNEKIRLDRYAFASDRANQDPISADYLFCCLNQVIDADAIVVHHTLSHCASVTEQIVRTKPGTWFGCPSGAIGWASGAALGAASAAPGKTVVAIMTDGGFVWGCPTSTFWTSANYRFPFLAVICNNKGYGAIRDVQTELLGEARPSETFIFESAVDFMPDYAMIARGAGAFGRTVTKPEEVMPALQEALAAVRNGQSAVLDVHLPRER